MFYFEPGVAAIPSTYHTLRTLRYFHLKLMVGTALKVL